MKKLEDIDIVELSYEASKKTEDAKKQKILFTKMILEELQQIRIEDIAPHLSIATSEIVESAEKEQVETKIIFTFNKPRIFKEVHELKLNIETIDCVIQHMNALLRQSRQKEKADFGEPCTNCKHALKTCQFDWFARMKPLIDEANTKISDCIPNEPK